MKWFSRYAERYVRRHFHSLRVLNAPPPVSTNPLLIYLNHASWWDPMICLALRNRFFPHRTSFAPIDAAALAKYRFFRKLGFFPVEQNSRRGTLDFLNSASAVLVRADAALWLTPQGRFTDVRERPLRLRAGLAHLASRVRVATYLPLALEFVYWEERLPEVCANFGEPLVLAGEQAERLGSRALTQQFQHRLQSAQDKLAEAVIKRDGHQLRSLTRNAVGVGGIYDLWRRTRAWWRGETFQLEHARK
jgi:1-acyl-sn-glycerol-3-phosphate acyltransferase